MAVFCHCTKVQCRFNAEFCIQYAKTTWKLRCIQYNYYWFKRGKQMIKVEV
jgi:hypothetical protein